MKTTTTAGDIYVRWQYDTVNTVKGNATTKTTCFAMMNGEVIGKVSATRFYKDKADKDLARKITLGKLLHVILPGRENKAQRRTFWTNYLNRKAPVATVSVEPNQLANA